MPEDAGLGLTEQTILQMLKKNVPEKSYNLHAEFVHQYLIPNIAEVIAANNEAIFLL